MKGGLPDTEEQFLEVREKDRQKARPGMTSFRWLYEQFDLPRRIRAKDVSELWLWGAPYMAWDELPWKTPADTFQKANVARYAA